jgi:hypothetical protein
MQAGPGGSENQGTKGQGVWSLASERGGPKAAQRLGVNVRTLGGPFLRNWGQENRLVILFAPRFR